MPRGFGNGVSEAVETCVSKKNSPAAPIPSHTVYSEDGVMDF